MVHCPSACHAREARALESHGSINRDDEPFSVFPKAFFTRTGDAVIDMDLTSPARTFSPVLFCPLYTSVVLSQRGHLFEFDGILETSPPRWRDGGTHHIFFFNRKPPWKNIVISVPHSSFLTGVFASSTSIDNPPNPTSSTRQKPRQPQFETAHTTNTTQGLELLVD